MKQCVRFKNIYLFHVFRPGILSLLFSDKEKYLMWMFFGYFFPIFALVHSLTYRLTVINANTTSSAWFKYFFRILLTYPSAKAVIKCEKLLCYSIIIFDGDFRHRRKNSSKVLSYLKMEKVVALSNLQLMPTAGDRENIPWQKMLKRWMA